MKKRMVLLSCLLLVGLLFTGCQFHFNKKLGKGSASLSIDKTHADMTNFSFDVEKGIDISGDVKDDKSFIYTHAIIFKDGVKCGHVMDGHYTKKFSEDNVLDSFNNIYQTILDFDDGTFDGLSANGVRKSGSCFYSAIEIADGNVLLGAKEGTDEYICVGEVSNSGYDMTSIFEAQLKALGFESDESVMGKENSSDSSEEQSLDSEMTSEVSDVSGTDMSNSSDYQFQMDNESVTVSVPDNFTVTPEDSFITVETDSINVTVGNSYVNRDDRASIDSHVESLKEVYNTDIDVQTVDFADGVGYRLVWSDGETQCCNEYRPVEGLSTYVEIQMSIYDISTDVESLSDSFVVHK